MSNRIALSAIANALGDSPWRCPREDYWDDHRHLSGCKDCPDFDPDDGRRWDREVLLVATEQSSFPYCYYRHALLAEMGGDDATPSE